MSSELLSVLCLSLILVCGCSPDSADIFMPAGDIRPPSILAARQRATGCFEIGFDEIVTPVKGSFGFSPETSIATPSVQGTIILVAIAPEVKAGAKCLLSGEAMDGSGNSTRFIFEFVGYNASPARLRLNEVQTGKNSSASNTHRDYLEFLAEGAGSLGGIQVRWASSTKAMEYSFPSCEVRTGDFIVLHCAPEGLAAELDETGADLTLSGGVDSSPGGRDFWASSGGIPDETGIITLREREESSPVDGFFYAAEDKSGEIDSEKISSELESLTSADLWVCSPTPRWEDAFLWKSSSSRPLLREAEGGKEGWRIGEAGSQSPGAAAITKAPAKASSSPKSKRKTSKKP
ncbi:MAG: hypothetical protein NT061_09280 [Spirochaetes bacterium]|nr:hypothetical protein [Spirochaetota bacterium]